MTLKRWDGAAFQDIAAIKRWDGASWVDLTVLKRWDGASWVDITLPGGSGNLSATASTGSVNGAVVDNAPAPLFVEVVSGNVTITVVGGTGPGPTYAWSKVSGSSAIFPTAPSSATTAFSATLGSNQSVSGTWKCTVTRGAETVTVNVNVSLSYFVESGA